ncbi:phosphoglucomutase [Steroidobacter denitrificans]|uniref:Phosphoglucomutase n=1 Tax=Steroidobacter denitrificans TaxID=465721 RepID=A0A127F7G4_STEDE|nr:phosphoglucomutase (alpha-D-glucose-1,6-bisphosphate-dependent) [Steroidobacter denitrificans]AMN46383.1 phosphoglucomutase [Steroidobacter denitrificans]
MTESISPLAGKPAPASILIDVAKLVAAYANVHPDPANPAERVSFGTSGHRGSSLSASFNGDHVACITQAVCDYRTMRDIDGPLFIGIDTHALSAPAFDTALEVLAANNVTTMVAKGGEFTPTPAVSLAILEHNRGRERGLADGIVVTPSHNPPDNGGFKYNPPNGGPADTDITGWIEHQANGYLDRKLIGVRRIPLARARQADSIREYDFLDAYVGALVAVIDFDAIRAAGVRMGVDPLGGAGVHYWAPIAERYRLDLDVVSEEVDLRFAFMSVDWDGCIRMDPSSPYAMQRLIGLKDKYDVAFACDTDHDRHGVVTRSAGLMTPNHYLAVLSQDLFQRRTNWPTRAAIGKTVVTTVLIDRVARKLGRELYEVPVGFKWFSDGLLDGRLGFGCEESAGASVLRRDGCPWTTDKDGIVSALLSAELMAHGGRDPGELFDALTAELGRSCTDRVQVSATAAQRQALKGLHASDIAIDSVAGDKVTAKIDRAPGNGASIGGIRVSSDGGWFAARPSGTEDAYKIYAESFRDEVHLKQMLEEAQHIVDKAIGSA